MGGGSKRNLPCPCGSGKKYKKLFQYVLDNLSYTYFSLTLNF
jgi:hypothetical protein